MIDTNPDEISPILDIGVRCQQAHDGTWHVIAVLPNPNELHDPDQILPTIAVYQDILASAIKYLAYRYILGPSAINSINTPKNIETPVTHQPHKDTVYYKNVVKSAA